MKVLLALDDSKFSEAAVQAVIGQMKPNDTEVRVLHVTEAVPLFVAGEFGIQIADADLLRKARLKHAQKFVGRAVGRLRKARLKAEAVIVEGDPKSKIIDYAAEWGADLIAFGSHGRMGMERFLMGSVSDAVARHARCSVQIVRILPRRRARKH
jgi:nucleotide-binding universal stress UspA family protein